MPATLAERLGHIIAAIGDIRDLLDGKTLACLTTERATRAALERFIEIISEASRHIPREIRDKYPLTPWRDIENIGNRLRHGYDIVSTRVLWDIHDHEIDALETVIVEIQSRLPKSGE